MTSATGPHRRIDCRDDRERFLAALFDRLWSRYRERVPYARRYEAVLAEHGGQFVNDHIAFRTLAVQRPQAGIASLARLFEALGYVAAGCYQFPDKHLSALHFQHPHGHFPKLFISELQTWKLSDPVRRIVETIYSEHRADLPMDVLAQLAWVTAADIDALLPLAVDWIELLPWSVPIERHDLEQVHRESQYAAWVLLHGYNVNHFTALINAQGVEALGDIDRTVAVLRTAGVPMKTEIEGAAGSKLRQTATEAVVVEVPVRVGDELSTMPWSYAYFELAERGLVTDPDTGRRSRFEGFLGAQATQLFEMTRVKPA